MTIDQSEKLPKDNPLVNNLVTVLGESEQVKELVDECAEELSSVNTGLKQELKGGNSPSGVEDALQQSEAVEEKVQLAADKLSNLNSSLENEVNERHILEEQLAETTKQGQEALHASLHDPLTGLPNRALFNDRLEHGLAQARRHGYPLALMFVDLDNFKTINDTYGHETGDEVLQTIAARLKENTRDDDTVCRHGGDEFLYVLMDIQDERDLDLIAQKIIQTVQSPIDIVVRDVIVRLNINASIGVSMFPKHGASAIELIDSADQAMYEAKRNKTGFSVAVDTPTPKV